MKKLLLSLLLPILLALNLQSAFAVQTFATFNASDKSADITLSNGNLTATAGGSGYDSVRATQGLSSGKWYWEFKYTTVSSADAMWGVANSTMNLNNYVGIDADGWGNYMPTGNKLHAGANTAYGTAQVVNDTLMVALDMDNGKIWYGKNCTWFNSGDPAAGTNPAFTSADGITGTLYPTMSLTNPNVTVGTANFGASAFGCTPPTGFNAGVYTGTPDTTPKGIGFFRFFKKR